MTKAMVKKTKEDLILKSKGVQLERVKQEHMTNEQVDNYAQIFINNKYEIEKLQTDLDSAKKLLLEEVNNYGQKDINGKHIHEETENFIVTNQRAFIITANSKAVGLFEKMGLNNKIKTTNTISIKQGIKDIPDEVIKALDKYFIFKVEKTVDKEDVVELYENNNITKEQYESITNCKITNTLKVIKK